MKAKETLKVLKITRPTLTKYVKEGRIKATKLPNGMYDYDVDSVLTYAGYTCKRVAAIYARVSTQKQKRDLQNQIHTLTQFANSNGFKIDTIYKDIASGLNYDRGEFASLVEDVMNYKVKYVFIENKDRLTRVSFNLWKQLFAKFNCELIVMNSDSQSENEDAEIFSDIISLLHCFVMKMYSNRRKKKLTLVKEDLANDIDSQI